MGLRALTSTLGRIGTALSPQYLPPNMYGTPPFLPGDNMPEEDDEEQRQRPIPATGGPGSQVGGRIGQPAPMPPDLSQGTGPALSAASAIGGNIVPTLPQNPPQFKQPPSESPMPVPPAAPNTPGGQKIGLARQIGGALIQGAGMLFPPTVGVTQKIGEKVAQGSYPEQQREYQRQMAIRQVEGESAKERAGIAKTQAETGEAAQRGEFYGQQAKTLEREGKRSPRGDFIPFGNGGIFDASARKVLVEPVDKSVKTVEERLLQVMDDTTLTPEQQKQKTDQLINAHNLLHPTTPIHGIQTDASGNSTLVVANPADPTKVQKVPLGKIGKPQAPPGAGQAYSPSEIRQNDQELAQGIVNGDPVSLKNLSLRTAGRSMVLGLAMKLAKEQGKKFDPTYPDRVIKQMDYFSNGKGADAIQSFDTFLAHAANALDAAQKVGQTNVKLLNKPLSWWRTEMSNDPAFAQLDVSLEPVAKEFESFLLNGRALYTDDRVKIDKLLNVNQPLDVKIATLRQLAVTAKDRYEAMNQRYKNLTKEDIPSPWTPAALDAARRLGIHLSDRESPASPNALRGPEIKAGDKAVYDALPAGSDYSVGGVQYTKGK